MTRARFTALDFSLYAAVVFAWGFSWIASITRSAKCRRKFR